MGISLHETLYCEMMAQHIGYNPKKILNTHKKADPWFWDKYFAHSYIDCEYFDMDEKIKENV